MTLVEDEQMVLNFGKTITVACWITVCGWKEKMPTFDYETRVEAHRLAHHSWVRPGKCCRVVD